MKVIFKKFLCVILTLVIILSMFSISVVYAATDAYEYIPAISYDKELSKDGTIAPIKLYSNHLGAIWKGGYVAFSNVDFGSQKPVRVEAETAQDESQATELRIMIDNPDSEPIAVVPITPKGWTVTSIDSAKITAQISGTHTVYVAVNDRTTDLYGIQFYALEKEKPVYAVYDQISAFPDLVGGDAFDVDMLYQLGMLNFVGEKFYSDMPVGRGDFAKVVYGICVDTIAEAESEKIAIANGETLQPPEVIYSDVKADSGYAKAVAFLHKNGIMNGKGSDLFEPYEFISKIDALTVMIRLLGYQKLADVDGGYPLGYLKYANSLGLLKRSKADSDVLTRKEFVNLIHNVLSTDCMVPYGIKGDYVTYETSGKILEYNQETYYGEGIVEATPHTVLGMPKSNLSANEVMIDGIKYNVGDTCAVGMLGMTTNFYYRIENDKRIIRAIVPDSKCEFVDIATVKDDILDINAKEIVYIPEGKAEEEEVEILSDAKIIYNGVASETDFLGSFAHLATFNGKIRVIDNDNGMQVITIEEHEDMILESVHSDRTGFVGDGADCVLDWNENDHVIIEDSNGLEVNLKKIDLGSVITFYESKNTSGKKLIRIYVGSSEVTGRVSKIVDNDIYVGDVYYPVSNSISKKPQLGQEGIFSLNIYGEIVDFKPLEPDQWQIGLFMKYAAEPNFLEYIKVKIMTSEGKTAVYDVAPTIKADGISINKKSQMLSGKDGFNGFSNLVSEKPIRYRLNENNQLIAIDTEKTIEGGSDDILVCNYDGYDKSVRFAYYRNRNILLENEGASQNISRAKLFVSNDAKIFAFYGSGENRDMNCTVGDMMKVVHTQAMELRGASFYSTTGKPYITDLVVWKDSLPHTYSILEDTTFVFEQEMTGINEEGEVVRLIQGWQEGGFVTFKVDPSRINDGTTINFLDYIKPGDCVEIRIYPDKSIYSVKPLALVDGKSFREGYQGGQSIVSVHTNSNVTGATLSLRQVYGRIIDREDEFLVLQVGGTSSNPDIELVPLSGVEICNIYENERIGVCLEDIEAKNIEVGDIAYASYEEGRFRALIINSLDNIKFSFE